MAHRELRDNSLAENVVLKQFSYNYTDLTVFSKIIILTQIFMREREIVKKCESRREPKCWTVLKPVYTLEFAHTYKDTQSAEGTQNSHTKSYNT